MAFILGVLTFVVFILEYGFGRTFLKQPIIICFLTGLIMGDIFFPLISQLDVFRDNVHDFQL